MIAARKRYDENHVKELVITKSINCESCGAGLSKVKKEDNTCDCKYCGNTNLIFDDGKTKVVEKPIGVPIPKESEVKGSETKMSTSVMIGLIVLGVVGFGAYFMYKKMKEKEKEKGNRKRLLLISK